MSAVPGPLSRTPTAPSRRPGANADNARDEQIERDADRWAKPMEGVDFEIDDDPGDFEPGHPYRKGR